MIKVRVDRFLPPADRRWDVSHESLPEAVRNELLTGVEAQEGKEDLVVEFQSAELHGYINLDSVYFHRDDARVLDSSARRIGAYVRAEFRWFLPDFKSINADDRIHATRIKAWKFVGVNIRPSLIPSGVIDRYVAFWQAWSVPVCDDVRRVVFSFLSQVK